AQNSSALAKQAEFLYKTQDQPEQRRLLETVLSNCTFDRGTLCPTYAKPFDLLVEGNQTGDWLGGRDSNPDTVVQSHVSYRWTTSQCQSRRFEAARTSDYSRSDTSGKRAIRKGRATTGGWPRRGAHGPEPGPAKREPRRDRGLTICPSPPRARHG